MKTTDLDAIEGSKENIIPLPQGRSASLLTKVLEQDAVSLEREQKQFEHAIETVSNDEDDPLEIFVSYVAWIESHYPCGNKMLIKVVERCVRRFKNDSRYRNDLRFLKFWLIVAHQASEPVDVFKYLSVNGIASDLALFYEEYAKLLEKMSRNKEALKVYELGISRKASPLERLNRNFIEFQKRMMTLTSMESEQGNVEPVAVAAPKPALKVSIIPKHSSSVSTKSSSKFKVFCDDPENESQVDQQDVLPSSSSANAWNDYVSEADKRKENTREASIWSGEMIPQKSAMKKKSQFQVYKDDDEEEEKNNQPIVSGSSLKLTEKDPFVEESKSKFMESLQQPQESISRHPSNVQEKESRKKIEKFMTDLKCVYQDKEEYSLEELKCMDLGIHYNNFAPKVQVQEKIKFIPKHVASPTINTKAAMEDVFEMFNQPISKFDDEDETISAKVYKPEKIKIGVFKDSDDEQEDEQEDAVIHATKTPKVPPLYPMQSTPVINDMENYAVPLNDSLQTIHHTRPSFRNFDIMTPITEISEDRTFAGLSTIQSEKSLHHSMSVLTEDSTGSASSFLSKNKPFPDSTEYLDLEQDLTRFRMSSDPITCEELKQESIDLGCSETGNELEPIEIPNPCDPREPKIIEAILKSVPIPENSNLYPTLAITSQLGSDFEKILHSREKKKRTSIIQDDSFELSPIGSFRLVKKLGQGGYGIVYLVSKSLLKGDLSGFGDDLDDLDASMTISGRGKATSSMALKIQSPPAPWEFYILSILRSRLPPTINSSIVKPVSCHLFQNESCLLMEYTHQGTLLQCINLANKGGYGAASTGGAPIQPGQGGLDELLAMFFTIEVLRTIETIHSAGLVHGDIKPDNFMIRLQESNVDWESVYQYDGNGGWATKGITLIDWGSAVDLLSFPEDQKFISLRKSKMDPSIDSWELRNNEPWTYECDWYGCAGVVYLLLFGNYMQVNETLLQENDRPTLSVHGQFKRYWQTDLWSSLFDLLLNSGKFNAELLEKDDYPSIVNTVDPSLVGPGTDFEVLEQEFPLVKKIHDKRLEMERWLQSNCTKGGKSLRNLLRRMEITLIEHLD